jgi:hypothetical protein
VAKPEKETYEAQAEAVKRLLEQYRDSLSPAAQKHLGCAWKNLEQMAQLRQMVIKEAFSAEDELDPGFTDAFVDRLIAMLHLPAEL